jgi:2-polyprenyl-6-methoxyphenol hydroxylase-like FAD-dependent oxidoreductase
VVRRALYPNEGPLKWNGSTMWRGVTLGQPFLSGNSMVVIGSDERRVVAYPISKSGEERGRARVNWMARVKTAADGAMPEQDWGCTARAEDILGTFAAFVFDFLDVPALIRGAEVIYQYPQVDRDPLPTWDFGRVTLLGDAAHPMHPAGSNGASQAILDARVLARELALQLSIEAAVSAYDLQRRPTTAAVVQANRQGALERCLNLVEERAPNGFTNLSDVVSPQELAEIFGDYQRTAGFNRDTLNSRPSLSVR